MATLIGGSYERFIWGYELSKNQSILKPLFSFPSHLSPIKSVAIHGPVAASSSLDDTIQIYDLSTAPSVIGSLTDHSSSVTSLSFFKPQSSPLPLPRNLLSASLDGTVNIYDADPFLLLKSVVPHRPNCGVLDLSLHPSGRLALSVGRDSCLSMLNLLRGRRSFCCHLDRPASIVRYDPDGARFFMASEERLSAHDAQDARLVSEFQCFKRVLCVAPSKNGILFAGGEDRNIMAWDATTGKVAYCIENAHSSRVKGLVVLGSKGNGENDELPFVIASASTDGMIKVWDVRMVTKEKPNPVAETNTKSRLTCLAGSMSRSSGRVGDSVQSKNQDDH